MERMKNNSENIAEFVRYYNGYKIRVYNYCLKMLNDKTLSEDIVQTTFLKLYENLGIIRDKEKVGIWIFTTARNEIYSMYRSKHRQLSMELSEEEENGISNDLDIQQEIEVEELKQTVINELEKINKNNSEAFILRVFGGMSYAEIANVMGTKISTIKGRIFKTRKLLLNKVGSQLWGSYE